MEFRILGPLEVVGASRWPLGGAGSVRCSRCSCCARTRSSRATGWSTSSGASGRPRPRRRSLQVYVSLLRKALGDERARTAAARLPAARRAGRARPRPLRAAARRGAACVSGAPRAAERCARRSRCGAGRRWRTCVRAVRAGGDRAARGAAARRARGRGSTPTSQLGRGTPSSCRSSSSWSPSTPARAACTLS